MLQENDILQIQTLQKTNPELYEELKKLETYYLQILSHTCHDLRNSTGLIDGYVQLLEKQMPELLTNPLWIKLRKNAKSSLLLLDHIGEFRYSHIIEDKEIISSESFLEYIRKAYPDIPVHAEPNFTAVYGNIHSIKASVLALIQNAVEADPNQSLPELTIAADSEFLHFLVRDNGIGFDSDFLPKVFEPFLSDKKGHAGLGLSLARNTALRHSGNLIIRNLHAPTVIDFYIPLEMK